MAEVRITKIMVLTIEDLLRLLPAVVPEVNIQVIDNKIALVPGLIIELENMLPAKVGAMSLPRLKLDLCFYDWQQKKIEDFVNNFNRVFQRGGG